MNKLELYDLASRKTLHLTLAQLPQTCQVCGTDMQGLLIAYAEDEPVWACAEHVLRRLLSAARREPSREPRDGPDALTRVIKAAHYAEPADALQTLCDEQAEAGRVLLTYDLDGPALVATFVNGDWLLREAL